MKLHPLVFAALALSVAVRASPVHAAAPAQEKPAARADSKSATLDALHAPWTAVLARHVRGPEIDYAALKKDRAQLDAYLAALESMTRERYDAATKKEQLAFWIDAYNAYTVQRVVDGYPVASVRDLGDEKTSVWERDALPLGKLFPKLAKDKLSLDDVENRILRPEFRDARVHAAIHAAARGCPLLRAEAYTGARLDAQLDEQVRAWLDDPTRNRFDREKSLLELSRVFEWFAEDFQRDADSVRAWIARYRKSDADWLTGKAKLDVRYLEFDWALDDVKPK